MARVRPQWLCVPVLLVCLYGSARCLKGWYNGDQMGDWRSATAYVLSEAYADDSALFYVGNGKRCFDYYCGKLDGIACPVTLDFARETKVGRNVETRLDSELLSSLSGMYERVWLLLAHDLTVPNNPVRAQILQHLDNQYVLQSEREFTGVKVRLYNRAVPCSPNHPISDGAEGLAPGRSGTGATGQWVPWGTIQSSEWSLTAPREEPPSGPQELSLSGASFTFLANGGTL